MKRLFFVFVAISLLRSGLLDAWGAEHQLDEVQDQHRLCQTDSECSSVLLECSCECGQGLNKRFAALYLAARERRCRLYTGPLCKMSCPGKVRCVDGKCQTPKEVEHKG